MGGGAGTESHAIRRALTSFGQHLWRIWSRHEAVVCVLGALVLAGVATLALASTGDVPSGRLIVAFFYALLWLLATCFVLLYIRWRSSQEDTEEALRAQATAHESRATGSTPPPHLRVLVRLVHSVDRELNAQAERDANFVALRSIAMWAIVSLVLGALALVLVVPLDGWAHAHIAFVLVCVMAFLVGLAYSWRTSRRSRRGRRSVDESDHGRPPQRSSTPEPSDRGRPPTSAGPGAPQ